MPQPEAPPLDNRRNSSDAAVDRPTEGERLSRPPRRRWGPIETRDGSPGPEKAVAPSEPHPREYGRRGAELPEVEQREPERLEPERLEPERLEAERREVERLEPERREVERLEGERRERDRPRQRHAEAKAERREDGRREAERLDQRHAEAKSERREDERRGAERLDRRRAEAKAERREDERHEAERLHHRRGDADGRRKRDEEGRRAQSPPRTKRRLMERRRSTLRDEPGDERGDERRHSRVEEPLGAAPDEPKPKTVSRDAPIGRTGGIYIPPSKLALMRKVVTDKNSIEYQRQYWEALRKSINGHVNKANQDNIPELIQEMFKENLIRGRGLLARTILRAQLASPSFTHVFAALLAVLNSKLPEIGRLLITRLVLAFRRAFRRNDKIVTLATLKFVAHLVNQKVLSEVTALEICALLLETPTNDGVGVCCGFVQECGQVLGELQPQALGMIFERLRAILNEGDVDMRTQYTIEKLFDTRRKRFADFPGVLPQLDLIEEDDQVTHTVDLLDEELQRQELLDVFQAVPPEQFHEEEAKWKEISDDVLGKGSEADESDRDGHSDVSSSDSEAEAEKKKEELRASGQVSIMDCTEQDLINLRKTVYLCIMSSASYEECVHKLLKLNIPEGQETEVCIMLIDCCSMERTFSSFFALQAERLCRVKDSYRNALLECFKKQYAQVHRLETNKLRNIAKFFAHLFATGALPWSAFEILVLTDEATTAASRIFIKIIFQDLADELGLENLQQRLRESELQPHLERSIFPRDSMANARFATNFFTAIGLGVLADELRAHMESARHRSSTAIGASSSTSCEKRCQVVCARRERVEISEEEDFSSSSISESESVSVASSESVVESSSVSASESLSVSESSNSESEESYSEGCEARSRRRCRVVCETVCPPASASRRNESAGHCQFHRTSDKGLGTKGSASSARTRESRRTP